MRRDPTVALYDSLARWQWWRRRFSRAAGSEGLEIRKRLLPPNGDGPTDGSSGLDEWLLAQLGERSGARMLDLGCGFGASIWRWLDRGVDRAVGVTPSGYQVRRATQVAMQRGVGERCRFVRQSLEESVDGSFDVVLAIEALGHSPDLAAVLANIRAALADDGVFVWVEDLLQQPLSDDADVALLASSWTSPPLRDVATVREQLATAGLRIHEEIDLTAQVPHRDLEVIDASIARLRRWRRLLPIRFARRIADAFEGGYALERLYANGAACYRFFMAMPEANT